MLSALLTPSAIDMTTINYVIANLQFINDVVIDLLEPYADLIDWDTIPINDITIILFSKFRIGKKHKSNRRWLESDAWMDMCNDTSMYDN